MKPALQKLLNDNRRDFGFLPDYRIYGLTLYAETGTQCRDGRIGVGTCILERVDHRKWDGDTIPDVCLWPYQFSCYNYGPKRAELLAMAKRFDEFYVGSKVLHECTDLARGLIAGDVPKDPDLANVHCCQYLNPKLVPDYRAAWIKAGLTSIKVIQDHEFFKDP